MLSYVVRTTGPAAAALNPHNPTAARSNPRIVSSVTQAPEWSMRKLCVGISRIDSAWLSAIP